MIVQGDMVFYDSQNNQSRLCVFDNENFVTFSTVTRHEPLFVIEAPFKNNHGVKVIKVLTRFGIRFTYGNLVAKRQFVNTQ